MILIYILLFIIIISIIIIYVKIMNKKIYNSTKINNNPEKMDINLIKSVDILIETAK